MKKSILFTCATLAAFGFQACNDDEQLGTTPVSADVEIQFGAMLETDGRSRTVYGDETDNVNGSGKVWPIYWSYSATDANDRDSIYIYSPQASATRNQAIYRVEPGEPNVPAAVDIQKVGAFGVQTGSEDVPYDFYAMYPASAVTADASGVVFNAFMPFEQNATYGNIDIENPESSYVLNPDMKCCFMTAKLTNVDLATTPTVNMTFDPFATAVDITIPGVDPSNTRNKALVTSVQVIATDNSGNPVPIAGDFNYNFDDGSFTFGENNSNIVTVNTFGSAQVNDGAFGRVGIPMVKGNTMRLQAFLLPNPEVKTLKVKVFTSDSQIWIKTLNMNDVTHQFVPKKINKVILPQINLAEDNFDYSTWISQLDPNIYLSEISLPGSCSSFSYTAEAEKNNVQMQTLSLEDQFKAGIRVFRCHIWLYDGGSQIPGVSLPAHFGINVNGGSEIISLWEAVQTLGQLMETSHSDEFCVLMVADYGTSNSKYDFKTFYDYFQIISNQMQDLGYLPEKPITSNTTIGDVKGKVLLKLQMNADGNNGDGSASGTYTEWEGILLRTKLEVNKLLDKVSGWSQLSDAPVLLNWYTRASQSDIFYSPMTFQDMGVMSYTEFSNSSNGSGTITLSGSPNGLAYLAGQKLLENIKWSTGSRWSTNANCPKPSAADLADSNKLWYIYSAQAAPTNLETSKNMVTASVESINENYLVGQTKHNKFYMTYLGGVSSSYTADAVTQSLVTHWNDKIGFNKESMTNSFGPRPFGWVLFNRIPAAGTNPSNTADILVQDGIQTVISKNNDIDFRLARKGSSTSAKVAPTGDVQGTKPAGPIF